MTHDPMDDLPLDEWMKVQPGRCRECGWHIDTMGHRPDCSVLTLPMEARALNRPVEDVPLEPTPEPEPPARVERPW